MLALLSSALSLAAEAPPAAPPQPQARPLIRWIDARGKVLDIRWRTKTEWVWSRSFTEPPRTPALRIWVELPAGTRVDEVKGDHVALAKDAAKDSESAPFSKSKQPVIAIDARGRVSNAAMMIHSRTGKHEVRLNLLALLPASPTVLWVDPACAEEEIRVAPLETTGTHVFAASVCERTDDATDFYLAFSTDAEYRQMRMPSSSGAGPGWLRFKLERPKVPNATLVPLGYVSVADKDGGASVDYKISYIPKEKPRWLQYAVGAGFTYFGYSEELDAVAVGGMNLTAKAGVSAPIVPKLLDASLSGYATLFNLFASVPDGRSAPRFYGLNARLGYRLPLAMGATEWSFLGGWYFWFMNVADRSYGVSAVGGPQLFVSMRKQQSGHRSYGGYVKFAPLSDGLALDLSNRELALGASYQLTSPQAKHVITGTLDVSHAQFHSDGLKNGFGLFTVSLGASFGL